MRTSRAVRQSQIDSSSSAFTDSRARPARERGLHAVDIARVNVRIRERGPVGACEVAGHRAPAHRVTNVTGVCECTQPCLASEVGAGMQLKVSRAGRRWRGKNLGPLGGSRCITGPIRATKMENPGSKRRSHTPRTSIGTAVPVLAALFAVGIGARGQQTPNRLTRDSSDEGRAHAEKAVVESMSSHHMHDGPHLKLTTKWPERPGDRQRATAIVAALNGRFGLLRRLRRLHQALGLQVPGKPYAHPG
jgi:hypothetical protein